ncbi:glycosyltransferase [Vibrio vulnificus]|uniref:glycosyltransferase family 2 protein n=1 Tax=Vibrio vulnificus TaxID=672 RepID=UPI001029CAE9|nr:glycosyltransferase family 2 protein [Vibrio vulnificus]EGQ7854596.1 glycosyltransferase [Vibrio vulnificus]EGR0668453.1 glycosyltransferase [Vibrio vulnificus]EHU9474086.1 glycosyltransferase [Vibrio vulnificus]EJB0233984.1 glycosyltransferase [Vibrio vulnificus]EJO9872732.1 glycosyltransferase [Vibrio vulnificus]
MKVSIITVCYNSAKTIKDTIESVKKQTYSNIEYIVIDGNSTDSTRELLNSYSDVIDIVVSEKDQGLYDAMNKGLALATGELVGILNSDDVLADHSIIARVVDASKNVDGVYGDVGFYDFTLTKKTRHYSSKGFHKTKFSRGFMPAHPSCYLKRELIERVGFYSLNFKIAADFDYLLRAFAIPGSSFQYLQEEVVKMREGGVSTSGISANILLNKEIIQSCRNNGLSCSWLSVLSKYPEKIMGLFLK